jgi:hypothetical protein
MQQVARYDNLLGIVDLIIFVSLYKYIDFLILLLRKALPFPSPIKISWKFLKQHSPFPIF